MEFAKVPAPMIHRSLGLAALLVAALVSCNNGQGNNVASASAAVSAGAPSASETGALSADGPPWVGIKKSPEVVAKALNPAGLPVYSGKTATIKGRVVIKGDPPPDVDLDAKPECAKAKDTYGKLFRVDKDGGVADVLVAVTGYTGFVPADAPSKNVVIDGCAYPQRTYAVEFGQRVDVSNAGGSTYFMPYLDGAPFRAAMVAVPHGDAVRLYPDQPGHYLLRDMMDRPFMLADVYVLSYSTADVTRADGRYEIAGVPVGKVSVDALLPVIDKTSSKKDVEVHEGENEIDLELTYDAKKDKPAIVPAPVWGDRQR
jgi:hypothetical protein